MKQHIFIFLPENFQRMYNWNTILCAGFVFILTSFTTVQAQPSMIWQDVPVPLTAFSNASSQGIVQTVQGDIYLGITSQGKNIFNGKDTLMTDFYISRFSEDFTFKSIRKMNNCWAQFSPQARLFGNGDSNLYVNLDMLSGSYCFDSLNSTNYSSPYHENAVLLYDSALNYKAKYDFDSIDYKMFLGYNHKGGPVYFTGSLVSQGYFRLTSLKPDLSAPDVQTPYQNNGLLLNLQPDLILAIDQNRYIMAGKVSGNTDIDFTASTYTFPSTGGNNTMLFVAILDSSFKVIQAQRFFEGGIRNISYSAGKIMLLGTYIGAQMINTVSGPMILDAPPLIPGNEIYSTFILRMDTAFIADWAYYFSEFGYETFVPDFNYMWSTKTNPKGFYLAMAVDNVPNLTNSSLNLQPEDQAVLMFCDTNGVFTKFGHTDHPPSFSSLYYSHPDVMLNDSTVFWSQSIGSWYNFSLNEIPLLYDYINTPGFMMAAYRVHPLNRYEIRGRLVADLNADFIVDSTDVLILGHPVTASPGNYWSRSLADGSYQLTLDSTLHQLTSLNLENFNSCQPSSYSVHLSDSLPADSGMVFYFTPEVNVCDLSVDLHGLPGIRLFKPYSLWIQIRNSGTLPADGHVVILYDGNLITVDSIAGANVVIYTDSLVLDSIHLSPLETRSILFYLSVDSVAAYGDSLNFIASVYNSSLCDIQLSNNYDALNAELLNSFDPNVKIADCSPVINANTVDSAFVIPYTIHFQNTGNDTAFRVVLVDTLSPLLDVTTLENFHASHPFKLALVDGRICVATFDPIALTDTGTNYASSEGYFSFSIKPKLPAINGTAIINRAAIFFDYNLPVMTEPSIVAFASPVGLSDMTAANGGGLLAFPNPAGDMVQVMCVDRSLLSSVRMMDLSGRVVMDYSGKSDYLLSLDLSGLSPGIYLIQATTSGDNLHTTRMVKR